MVRDYIARSICLLLQSSSFSSPSLQSLSFILNWLTESHNSRWLTSSSLRRASLQFLSSSRESFFTFIHNLCISESILQLWDGTILWWRAYSRNHYNLRPHSYPLFHQVTLMESLGLVCIQYHHVAASDSSDTLRITFSQYRWVKNLSDDIHLCHWRGFKVINRIYSSDVPSNYSRLVSSLLFAGTVLGMISFGYISDRLGRKFGMVSWIIYWGLLRDVCERKSWGAIFLNERAVGGMIGVQLQVPRFDWYCRIHHASGFYSFVNRYSNNLGWSVCTFRWLQRESCFFSLVYLLRRKAHTVRFAVR